MFDINPREKHGQAMALFGGGVMIGPILGPVLGGWLTDNYNWRWVFLVNLPVGILCLLLMARFMPKTETHQRKFDMFGFALLALALGGAAAVPRPRRAERLAVELGDPIIELGLAIAAGWMFVVHMITAKHPLFERAMFTDRNFATEPGVHGGRPACCCSPGLALLPPLLQNHVRLFGAAVGLPDRAARGRHADLDAARRPADRQDRCAAAGRDRRRA